MTPKHRNDNQPKGQPFHWFVHRDDDAEVYRVWKDGKPGWRSNRFSGVVRELDKAKELAGGR